MTDSGTRVVTVFGGTGFLGRRIVRHLLAEGFVVRVAARHPERFRKDAAEGGDRARPIRADVGSDEAVAAALEGAYGAVNAVSLYVERGKATFERVHVEAAARVAALAKDAGVERHAHVSGIGADPESRSPYISARGRGEAAVESAFSGVTLIRPAVMFGPDDAFLTTMVRLLRVLPLYPLFGDGSTGLQPVYVENVGKAVTRLMTQPHPRTRYEFGGPTVYRYDALVRSIASRIDVHPYLVPVPFAVWEVLARTAGMLPGTPLTRHQVALMRHDNVASADAPGLIDVSVAPTAIEEIASSLLPRSENSAR